MELYPWIIGSYAMLAKRSSYTEHSYHSLRSLCHYLTNTHIIYNACISQRRVWTTCFFSRSMNEIKWKSISLFPKNNSAHEGLTFAPSRDVSSWCPLTASCQLRTYVIINMSQKAVVDKCYLIISAIICRYRYILRQFGSVNDYLYVNLCQLI